MSGGKVAPTAEPTPATDRTDAPLVSRTDYPASPNKEAAQAYASSPTKAGDAADGSPVSPAKNALGIPSTMKVLDKVTGKVTTMNVLAGGAEVAMCCGLPAPPGGWWGPFGFFRLVSYAFAACAVFGIILAIMAATGGPFRGIPFVGQPDGFAALASLLMSFAAVVCGFAAYAHEGLANEVTAMAKQNNVFSDKNDKLEAQVKELGGVGDRLEKLNKSMGVNMDKLQETLQSLHQVNCTMSLSTVLRAFIDADSGYGNKDTRLEGLELDDFFDSCGNVFTEAAPDFDVEKLKEEAMPVGIGMWNMRFLVNAVVASCDEVPGRSTAMLTLVLFGFNPEKHDAELAVALKQVLKKPEADIAKVIAEKKTKACPEEHGRIPGQELADISREIMAVEPTPAAS